MFTKNYLNIVNNANLTQTSWGVSPPIGSSYTLYTGYMYANVRTSSNVVCDRILTETTRSVDSTYAANIGNFFLKLLFSATASNASNAGFGMYVCYKDTISESDYQVDISNVNKVAISRNATSGEYNLTVTNNTSSDFTFNTIQVAANFNAVQTSASITTYSTYKFLLAELDVGTITLAPNESKTFSISKENLAS